MALVPRGGGHVRLPEGGGPLAGIAWLRGRAEEDGPWRVLARAALDDLGRFVLTCKPGEPTSIAGGIEACAAPNGYDALSSSLALGAAGQGVEVRLTVEPGSAVHGRVVDPDGRPVAGLPIRFVPLNAPGAYAELDALDPSSDAADRSMTPLFARALTDAEGRFTLRTDLLELRRYAMVASPRPPYATRLGGFLSESPEWFLREDEERARYRLGVPGTASAESLLLVAEAAVSLRATVLDAVTAKPIGRFEGHAHWSTHGELVAFDGRDGRLGLVWRRWWRADEAAVVDVAVQARGYVPVEVPVPFDSGVSSAALEIRLAPVLEGDEAQAVFEIVDASGRPFDGPWLARMVDPRDVAKTMNDLGVLERREAGVYAATVPPGRWTILVKPSDGLGLLHWTGLVELDRGATKRVRVLAGEETIVELRD